MLKFNEIFSALGIYKQKDLWTNQLLGSLS